MSEPDTQFEISLTITPVPGSSLDLQLDPDQDTEPEPGPTTADELILASLLQQHAPAVVNGQSMEMGQRYLRVVRSEIDTNGNGLFDWWELAHFGPLAAFNVMIDPNADPDLDGFSNSMEATYGTDPNLDDTDGDGFPDGDEATDGTDPNSAASYPSTWVREERALEYHWDPNLSTTSKGSIAYTVSWPGGPPPRTIYTPL